MLAVDTNVIVRFLTRDHSEQAARALALFDSGEQIFVGSTVLLEAEWVLRAAYGFERGHLSAAIRALAGLPNVVIENPPAIALALDWLDQGMDFAAALHLSRAEGREAFVTFDRPLATLAQRITEIELRVP